MPSFSTPGVYTEETPPDEHVITGVATSITAFTGRAWRGPVDTAVAISSHADYVQLFGGTWREAPMSAAVQQYFDNGGAQALIVRVASRDPAHAPTAARIVLDSGHIFHAASVGSWGRNLRVTITRDANATDDDTRFDLAVLDDSTLHEDSAQRGGSGASEYFATLSMDPASARYAATFLASESQWLRAEEPLPFAAPSVGTVSAKSAPDDSNTANGGDGGAIGFADLADPALENDRHGMYALLDTDLFNLLCIPPYAPDTEDNGIQTWTAASQLCRQRRAFLIVDAPQHWDATTARTGVAAFDALEREHAAIYFPRLIISDAANSAPSEQTTGCAPCGAVAGIFARTDAQRGVWKAPSGPDATLLGFANLTANMTDADQEALTPCGINALRLFPNLGIVTWGTRTLAGDDQLSSEWKYIPTRRMALFLEESLLRGTQWTPFESNDETLWARLRQQIDQFMQCLYRRGAFAGTTQHDAYFVKCDQTTTSISDIDRGIVNVVVGFALLKPAEFIIVNVQQMTREYQG